MKKLLLLGAILAGAVSASQAGISLHIGIGLPLPRLPIIIGQPAPVYAPPVLVAPPVCAPRVVVPCPPPVYYRPAYRHGYDRHDRRDHFDGRGNGHWR